MNDYSELRRLMLDIGDGTRMMLVPAPTYCEPGHHELELTSINNGLLVAPTPIVYCHRCSFHYFPLGNPNAQEEGFQEEQEGQKGTDCRGTCGAEGSEEVRLSLE